MPRFPRGKVPLARALSKLGAASRSEAVRLIREGRVTVAGRTVTDPARAVSPERDTIVIDGDVTERAPWRLIAFNKPSGVVTTRRDPEGRRTVFDVLRDIPGASAFRAVGRLDLATSGLLLLTTDTRLADRLTDPANAIPRRYVVTARGFVADDPIQQMLAGLDSRGERLTATHIEVLKRSRRETHLIVELTEGKNREIRRLLEAVGSEVTRLKRIAFGGVELGDLKPGEWREISRDQAVTLFNI